MKLKYAAQATQAVHTCCSSKRKVILKVTDEPGVLPDMECAFAARVWVGVLTFALVKQKQACCLALVYKVDA